MSHISNLFGSMVFHDALMQEKLPKDAYRALKKSMETGTPLELSVANVVAATMKEWALSKGATHFTHWFQPMTGITAEKHDSFISPTGDGRVIMEFSGSELVRGEPDASSFPSGGLRQTFEARGYTVWDVSSHAFIKDNTLCIPTAFCSYSGEALDKKTPLLRSMQALDKEAMRIVKLFGNKTAKRVISYVGPEQEYFLIDKEMFKQRPDLIHTDRTLFGAPAPKGQEMGAHYFGSIKPKVLKFMSEVDEELWKLGVSAKTRHNETAPAQHELAIIYSSANVATDHNQLCMEVLKKVADRNGLACLLHEKPFASVSGSGKHNNWSIATDTGQNLLEPGETPYDNAQFLLFLLAVIKAVDLHQDLLRLSAASAGNDHRLGANEAPPAIISVFLGEHLTEILEAIDAGENYHSKESTALEIGVSMLPHFPKDTTDRNRTSPFAFTGNKFEFRMVGSAFSIAGPNIILNTAVADVLHDWANTLETATDFNKALTQLLKNSYHTHKKIIFNGNNYANEWLTEANARGLSQLSTTADALPAFICPKSVELFTRHQVFCKAELHARYEILMEIYCQTLQIEGKTMLDMVRGDIFPAIIAYQNELATLLNAKTAMPGYDTTLESNLLAKISKLSTALFKHLDALSNALAETDCITDTEASARHCRDQIVTKMQDLRLVVDELETYVAKKHWPYPSYANILYPIFSD